LSRHVPGVTISSDSWYQFSNRVAFAETGIQGIPTALIYLGFLNDKGISPDPLRDHDHWLQTVLNSTRDTLWSGPSTLMGPRCGF
jgi:hypothetical protein